MGRLLELALRCAGQLHAALLLSDGPGFAERRVSGDVCDRPTGNGVGGICIADIHELCCLTKANDTSAYYGPHLHAAMKCLRAGFMDNAISWMVRDIGEADCGPECYPQPGSLVDRGDWIEFQ